jgi:hypothetical protein
MTLIKLSFGWVLMAKMNTMLIDQEAESATGL